jgi:hypothetical protein
MISLIAILSLALISYLLLCIYLKLQDIQNEIFHNTQELKKQNHERTN